MSLGHVLSLFLVDTSCSDLDLANGLANARIPWTPTWITIWMVGWNFITPFF